MIVCWRTRLGSARRQHKLMAGENAALIGFGFGVSCEIASSAYNIVVQLLLQKRGWVPPSGTTCEQGRSAATLLRGRCLTAPARPAHAHRRVLCSLKMNPLQTLYYVAPIGFCFLIVPFFFVEFACVRSSSTPAVVEP